jgi:spore coat protein CotH
VEQNQTSSPASREPPAQEPNAAIEKPPKHLSAASLRELRRDRSIAPGGAEFDDFIRAFLPLVYGSALSLVPEDTAAVERIVLAVFRSFAVRWRRLPRRTVVAVWLFRSTWFAARRERRRLRLPAPAKGSVAAVNLILFRALNRLRPVFLDGGVLGGMLRENVADVGRAMRRREARAAKLLARGAAKLAKALRRERVTTAPDALLAGIVSPAPIEIESLVLRQMREWSPRGNKDGLVRATLRAWRWVGFKRLLRRGIGMAAVSFGVLLAAGFTVVWLAQQGYLTAWFMRLGSRQILQEIPELAQPARAWPGAAESAALAARLPPRTVNELYGLTNLWTAKLSFTRDQWNGLQPQRIPPVPHMMQDGKLALRNPKARRNGLAGVVGLDFDWVRARLEFAGVTYANVAVRYRGNGTYLNSLFGPKQSYKVDLNKFVKGQNLAGIHTLNFVNAIPDFSYLHDALAEKLFRDLGIPAPRTAFAYLTVEVAGQSAAQPLGLYVLVENIDARFAAEHFGSKTVPVFKPVTPDLFKDLGSDWKAYAGIYDLKTQATPEQLERVIQFAHLVTAADDAEFARRLPEFLDLEEFAAFLAGHVLLASYDGFLANGQNYYLYLDPRHNKFGFVPWDQDHAWGEFGYVATAERRERASIWQPSSYRNRFLERVLKVQAFQAVYRRQLERAMSEHFTIDRLYRQIDQCAAIIRPAIAAESDFRLKRFDAAISTNWVSGPRDGAPEGPKSPIHQIKRFVANRVESIRDQLDGKAQGATLHR